MPLRRLLEAASRRLNASLYRRLLVSFLATAAAVLLLVAVAVFLRSRATLRQQLIERLTAVAILKEAELNYWIAEQRGDVAFLAQLQELGSSAALLAVLPEGHPAAAGPTATLRAQLESARAISLDAAELFLMSVVGGRVLASTDSTSVGAYRVGDLYFTNGLRGVWIQNVYASAQTGRPTMTVAAPVRAGGTTVAVLAAHLDLTRIDQILASRSGLGTRGEAYLVTPLSDFVSASRFGRAEMRRGVHSQGIQAALAGNNGAGLYPNYEGRQVLGAWRWIPTRQLALLVEIDATEAFAPARQLVYTILAFGMAALAVMAFAMNLVSRRITQPILAIAGTAERVARGDFDAAAPVTTRDEVGLLARTFNEMTGRLRTLYDDLSEQIAATGTAYRALEESQQLLQSFVDNTSNLIMAFDQRGRLLLINRAIEDLFALRRAEVRGRAPAGVLPAEIAEAVESLTPEVIRTGAGLERDLRITSGAATLHYHLVAFPLAREGRPPFGAGIVGVDLTERVRQEEEHRRLEAGVQQAQKLESLGLLAGGIAHDFNNILTAIVGGATMAMEDLPASAPARADLEQVVTAAERAAKLTRQMLAYAGRASFAIETFDLNSVIREMAELIGVSVSRTVRLEEDLGSGLPPVRADRTQVSQVVLNMVTNAAEATAARGGRVRLRTRELDPGALTIGEYRFAPAEAAAYVELTVTDDGTGIDPETMERMFDPFYSTKGSGRGLGLAAVLGIVKSSGGALRVTSRPGEGTTFQVIFPAAGAPIEQPPGAPARDSEQNRGAGTILLVDDEDAVRRMIRRALERAGYQVLEAANGREGVDQFEKHRDQLSGIVLDVTMPVMGGAEAFQLMRQMGPPVPVLVSSGFDHQDTAHIFTGPGVDFLQKPYRPEELLERLRALALEAARAVQHGRV